jgi:hypothetical protein
VILSAVGGLIGKLATRLRFPQLFAVTAVIFLVDLVIPDLIPFADELLLGLLTVLLGMWRQKSPPAAPRPMKDVTPGGPTGAV